MLGAEGNEYRKRTYVVYDDFLYAIIYGIYVHCLHRVPVLPLTSQDFARETESARTSEESQAFTLRVEHALFPGSLLGRRYITPCAIPRAAISRGSKTKMETHPSNHALRRRAPDLWYRLCLFAHYCEPID